MSHTSYMFLAGDTGVPGAPGVPGVSTGETNLYIIANNVRGGLSVIFTNVSLLETLQGCERATMADKFTRAPVNHAKDIYFYEFIEPFLTTRGSAQ